MTVAEIKKAIAQLPKKELWQFAEWFEKQEAKRNQLKSRSK
jgi:hypothetical protein